MNAKRRHRRNRRSRNFQTEIYYKDLNTNIKMVAKIVGRKTFLIRENWIQ